MADAADAFAAMATDDAPRLGAGQAAAASNNADGASDMEADSDEDDAMVEAPMNGSRKGKKRATEGFRQKVGWSAERVGGQGCVHILEGRRSLVRWSECAAWLRCASSCFMITASPACGLASM